MWLFAAASVVNITDISFFYQFESILWWFGVAKALKWWKIDPTGSPCADCNKALLKNKVNFFGGRSGRVGQEVIMSSNKKNYITFTPLFYFWYWKRTVWWLKKYIGLFTFFYLKSAGRSECMGHNTCKSMGRVLCVVRRYILGVLTFWRSSWTPSWIMEKAPAGIMGSFSMLFAWYLEGFLKNSALAYFFLFKT